MLLEIVKKHDLICDNFDLGSPFILIVTIQGDRAMITNSNEKVWASNITKENVGCAVAETIMLKGLETSQITWGGFLQKQELITFDKVLKLDENDFDFDTDFLKLWTLLRVACNIDLKGKIFELSFDSESNNLDYKVYSEEEYKESYKELKKYYKE